MDDDLFTQLLDRVIALELAFAELVHRLERAGSLPPGDMDIALAKVSMDILEGSARHRTEGRPDLSEIADHLETLIEDIQRARKR